MSSVFSLPNSRWGKLCHSCFWVYILSLWGFPNIWGILIIGSPHNEDYRYIAVYIGVPLFRETTLLTIEHKKHCSIVQIILYSPISSKNTSSCWGIVLYDKPTPFNHPGDAAQKSLHGTLNKACVTPSILISGTLRIMSFCSTKVMQQTAGSPKGTEGNPCPNCESGKSSGSGLEFAGVGLGLRALDCRV